MAALCLLSFTQTERRAFQLGQPTSKWDGVLQRPIVNTNGRTSQNMRLASVLSPDVMLLSKCDIICGQAHEQLLSNCATSRTRLRCDGARRLSSRSMRHGACLWLVPAGDGVNGDRAER